MQIFSTKVYLHYNFLNIICISEKQLNKIVNKFIVKPNSVNVREILTSVELMQ